MAGLGNAKANEDGGKIARTTGWTQKESKVAAERGCAPKGLFCASGAENEGKAVISIPLGRVIMS